MIFCGHCADRVRCGWEMVGFAESIREPDMCISWPLKLEVSQFLWLLCSAIHEYRAEYTPPAVHSDG